MRQEKKYSLFRGFKARNHKSGLCKENLTAPFGKSAASLSPMRRFLLEMSKKLKSLVKSRKLKLNLNV
jgi:hypothetical protein